MMNEILKAMETRQSVRAYRPEQIDEETLNAILRAGTFAPSGMGRQSGKIVVVQDPARTRPPGRFCGPRTPRSSAIPTPTPSTAPPRCWWCWLTAPFPPGWRTAAW